MGSTACTIKHITVETIVSGARYYGPVDKDGIELGHSQAEISENFNKRTYFCSNCMKNFPGEETFDEVKKHFGTFPA
jgi:hypothetical protein